MLDLNMKKFLITGGCGFIGSNFIEHIFSNYTGFTIVNFDKMGIGSRQVFHPKMSCRDHCYHMVERDIRTIDEVEWLKNMEFDYIFHFAAESHVDRSISGPTPFIENNVMGMVELLEWVRNHQPQARMVNISTDEVYGHLGKDEPAFTENSLFNPRSPYSASKASADHIANSYVETYGLDIVTTHCCNNFGKHQGDEKLIPTIIRKIVRGEHIPVYGTGENIREWIHVDDHNKSILEIAEMGESGQSYNIGSGFEVTNLQMVVDIAKLIDINYEIEFVEDRKGHDFRYAIESLKYKRQFNLKDHYEAMKDTVEFYMEQYNR